MKDFYGRLGFSTVREERGEDGYVVLRRGPNVIAFWPGSPAVIEHPYFARFGSDAPRGYGVEIVIEVADVAALYVGARLRGIVAPLERRPWGVRLSCCRPVRVLPPSHGAAFGLTQVVPRRKLPRPNSHSRQANSRLIAQLIERIRPK